MEQQEFKLFTINDEYVNYLRKFDNRVSSNKEERRAFERKYLGTILKVNDINYFVPLASPKDSDYYINEVGEKCVRKSIVPIMRIIHNEKDGRSTLLGTLKFSNMIPIPDVVVKLYDAKNEPNTAYQALIYKEWEFIRANKSDIYKSAKTLYTQKTKNVNGIGYLKSTVDFLLLEEKAKEYFENNQSNAVKGFAL